jgi:HK97 family phage major capsid protein
VQLTGKVDAAYLQNASFLMNRATWITLMQLVGSSGNFMFPVTTNPPTLLGFPVYFSPSMPSIAAGAQVITFGDHSKFLMREVIGSLVVRTLMELFMLNFQRGYQAFWRVDGGLLVGTTNPVAILAMHS